MFYEVYIPAKGSEEFDVTVTVEADNWMAALKSGLERTGQTEDGIRNVMCDIKEDNSIHVIDGTTQRVFVLKEMEELPKEKKAETKQSSILPISGAIGGETQVEDMGPTEQMSAIDVQEKTSSIEINLADLQEEKRERSVTVNLDIEEIEPIVDVKPPSIPPVEPAVVVEEPAVVVEEPAVVVEEPAVAAEKPADVFEDLTIPIAEHSLEEQSYTSPDGRISIGSATYEALHRQEHEAKIIRERRAPSGTRPAVSMDPTRTSSIFENVLEDVFLEMQKIREKKMGMEEVIEFVMELVMEKIRAEAGSIMFADLSGTELYFAAARGPKAHEIMDFRVPMGVGIVGFCVREGVSLAISDVEKDPRFYKQISEKLGYNTHNLCCVPIQHEGRVYGAIELMNKENAFDTQEVNALTYVGKQMAQYIFDLIMEQEKIS